MAGATGTKGRSNSRSTLVFCHAPGDEGKLTSAGCHGFTVPAGAVLASGATVWFASAAAVIQ